MSESMRMKFTQIAVTPPVHQELYDKIYALGEDGRIYCFREKTRGNLCWWVIPNINPDKLEVIKVL